LFQGCDFLWLHRFGLAIFAIHPAEDRKCRRELFAIDRGFCAIMSLSVGLRFFFERISMYVAYPPVLEAAQWDKKKGVIAKMTVETGIGKALTELKTLYNNVNLEKLTAGGYGKLTSNEQVDIAHEHANDHYKAHVPPVQAKLKLVAKLADDTVVKFKKNKLIPKASIDYVLQIAAACHKMDTDFNDRVEEQATFDTYKAALKRGLDGQRKTIVTDLHNLEAAVKACLEQPTAANWVKLVRQRNRQVGNTLGNVPEYKLKFWAVWQPLDGLQIKEQSTPDEVKAACNKLLHEILAVRAFASNPD
jgi:hypothetical protein